MNMPQDEKKEYCLSLLRQMHQRTGQLPKKSDFEEQQVMLIKNCLGPWPRALEAAGLKEPPAVTRSDRNREKRKAARRRRRQAAGDAFDGEGGRSDASD